jgi:phosphohistidine phosphatase
MLTLCLFRHAKSSWDDPGQADAERPLNGRGRKAATAMGRYIAAEGLLPDRILCSTAVRTRETVARAFGDTKGTPEPEFSDAIYLAPAERLLELVRKLSQRSKRVMIVGHNPGLQDLALDLVASGDDDAVARLAEKLPTAALAVITFEAASWRAVGPRGGRLERFVTPRDLAAGGA